MPMDLKATMMIAGAGMKAQSERMRVVAENVANADSISVSPGGTPYQRKTITFQNVLDKEMGMPLVKVTKIGVDNSDFGKAYKPGHPGADKNGYVLTPNVQTMIEMQDMKQAQRSYEANLNTIEITKTMLARTLDLLR